MQDAYPTLGGVFPARETYALKSFEAELEHPLVMTEQLSVGAILNTEYGSDAHFVTYRPGTDVDAFPRCALSVLPEIRAGAPGADLVSSWWVLEQDNPGHKPHTDPKAAIVALRAAWEALDPKPHAAYTTRAGWRFLWALDRPLPVDESASRRLSFGRTVLPAADPGTNDWTRLWRAPKVTRDGVQQWTQSWFDLLVADASDASRPLIDPTRYAALAPTAAASPVAATTRPLDAPQPSHEDAAELLDDLFSPRNHKLLIELRRRATSRNPLENVAFLNEALAPQAGPGRSNAIQLVAGQAAAFWTPLAPQVTPEIAYALLWPAVAAFDPDTDPKGPQDWTRHLWEAVSKYWPRSLATVPKQLLPKQTEQGRELFKAMIEGSEEKTKRQTTILSSMVEGVQLWNHRDFPPPSQPHAQSHWVQQHLLLISRKKQEIHILRPDGFYDPDPIHPSALIPALRARGLDSCGLIYTSTQEGSRPISIDSIIREHAVPISHKKVYAGIHSSNGAPGGILRAPDYGTDPELHLSFFCRKTPSALEPSFDPEVDAWLQALAGPRYTDLCRWLSYALDFQSPIAALALTGASSVGKKMLLRGLTECIYPGGSADGRSFGRFNEQMLRTPFLFIDEGFASKDRGEDRAVQFRLLIDGEGMTIEPKHETPYKAHIPVRMVFTSNNTNFADEIAGGRDLTPDDEQAIATRTLIIPIQPQAREFLQSRGGLQHTRGWVAPDNTSPAMDSGQYRVARHFLHLYETRHQYQTGNRLLVEGKPEDLAIFRSMQTRTEIGERVFDSICDLIEQSAYKAPKGVVYRAEHAPAVGGVKPKSGLYVTADALCQHIKDNAHKTGMKVPSQKRATQILKGYALSQGKRIKSGDHTRYTEIDLQGVLALAEESGRSTEIIQSMIEGSFKEPRQLGLPAGKSLASILQNDDAGKVN